MPDRPETDNQETEFSVGLQVLRTFKTQANKHHFAMGEFIDNSVQSYLDHKDELKKIPGYKPNIRIEVNQHQICIEDNCAGIATEFEKRAFDIGNPNMNAAGIGTYGMGMKVSACWYSDTWTVTTKALHEDETKTWSININKIVDDNNLYIGPERKAAKGAEPFTKILMTNLHRYPKTASVTSVKDMIRLMYKFFIIDDEINFYYNGEKLTYIEPPIKTQSTYPHSVDKPLVHWFGEIPKLDLGDGYFAQGFVFLHNSKVKNQSGFGIYWKNRLIEGSWTNPWLPKASDYEDPIEAKTYGIYLGDNTAINQRLEGWLHISNNFEVVHTKNQVIWVGKEEILKKKLKAALEEVCLVGDDSGETYDFIYQAKNAKYKWTPGDEPGGKGPIFPPGPKGPGGGDGKDGGTINIPPPTPTPAPSPAPAEPGAEIIRFKHGATSWEVSVIERANEVNDFVEKVDGPDGQMDDDERKMMIKINIGHPFIYKYFSESNDELSIEGIKKLAIAMILSQVVAEETGNKPVTLVRLFNQIIGLEIFN